jgi:hypothetical protein
MIELQEYLHSLFDYDDGWLFWKVSQGSRKAGDCAGWWHGTHWRMKLDGIDRYVHHVIWAYHYGEWPKVEIDHHNGDGSDNRIDNLREATSSQNKCNANFSVGVSGSRGVHPNSKSGLPWRAAIQVDGQQINLGVFETIEDAELAYKNAAELYHGEFAFHNRTTLNRSL